MPILFRPRATMTKASMAQASEISSLTDVQHAVNLQIPMHCVYHGYNERNGWDEYRVAFAGDKESYVGYTNAYLEPVQ
jgi:hypothetical protein